MKATILLVSTFSNHLNYKQEVYMTSKNIYSIYRITNIINNKIYIGFTSQNPTSRFNQHCLTKEPKYQKRSPLSSAILKYGKEFFIFDILYQSSDYTHTVEIESKFIEDYNSLTNTQGGHGYNVDKGGFAHRRSKETIEKHRAKVLGVKKSKEHAENIKKATTGSGNPMYGKYGKDNPRYGMKHSEESKNKISEARNKRTKLIKDGILPPTIRPSGYKMSDESKQNQKNAKKPKYINVKIQDPFGVIYSLETKEELHKFLIENNLNNFMSKTISKERDNIKGFVLLDYELNPEYNGST